MTYTDIFIDEVKKLCPILLPGSKSTSTAAGPPSAVNTSRAPLPNPKSENEVAAPAVLDEIFDPLGIETV